MVNTMHISAANICKMVIEREKLVFSSNMKYQDELSINVFKFGLESNDQSQCHAHFDCEYINL